MVAAALKPCLHRFHSKSFATAVEILVVIAVIGVVSH